MPLGRFEKFEREETLTGHLGLKIETTRYYFRLKATNGRIIAQSEGYNSKYARDKGINSVRRNAPFARTVETEQ